LWNWIVIRKEADLPLFTHTTPKYLSVTQLNQLVRVALETRLDAVWVLGEISNFRIPPSGHCYFTLKDDKSQISAVLFRRQGQNLAFVPENGMEVLCFGRVSLYAARGDLQIYVESLEPRGQGALYLAFEQLKKKLAQEGLFAADRKRPLPFLPDTIGIVTSDTGAALQDMLRIIRDRYPDRRVIIRPVKVQGVGSAKEIAAAISDLCTAGVEVMIVGRGGGSLEDLWAFNEEVVARAIFACSVPVISAVGHEIDFTIADFVADQRAPTPTAAAEMVVPCKKDLLAELQSIENQLLRCMQSKIDSGLEICRGLTKRLSDPGRKLREKQQHLDDLSLDLQRRFLDRLNQFKERLGYESSRLGALSPLAVLDRGYSITHKMPDEAIVKSADVLDVGDLVRITLARGKANCRVEGKE
jgi:exodeoxyribonuclease VII large subunit